VTRAHAAQLAERRAHEALFGDRDDFGHDRTVRGVDPHRRTDRELEAVDLEVEAEDARDAPLHARLRGIEYLLQERAHARTSLMRVSASEMRASTRHAPTS